MISKDFIQNEINNLKDMLENARKKNLRTIIKACEEDIEQYQQVLKDLDELEELKKVMGTPIQDIMKRLKVLDILKDSYVLWVEKGELLCGRYADREITLDREYFDSDEDYNLVKELI